MLHFTLTLLIYIERRLTLLDDIIFLLTLWWRVLNAGCIAIVYHEESLQLFRSCTQLLKRVSSISTAISIRLNVIQISKFTLRGLDWGEGEDLFSACEIE